MRAGRQRLVDQAVSDGRHDAQQHADQRQQHLRNLHHHADFELPLAGGLLLDQRAGRDRKLAPKNLTNEARVNALVRMAMAAQRASQPATLLPCTAAT